jgi:hypothetical protein
MGIIRQVQARSSTREHRAAASSVVKVAEACARPRARRKTVHVHQHWKNLHPGASRIGSAISTPTIRCSRRQCSNGSVLSTAAKSTQAQFLPGRRAEVAVPRTRPASIASSRAGRGEREDRGTLAIALTHAIQRCVHPNLGSPDSMLPLSIISERNGWHSMAVCYYM